MERLDAFMARAAAAYYASRDPYADFTTSPEITQVFGELLGLWAAVAWDAQGRPPGAILAEAGPGRGTLMSDALRAIGRVMPEFRAALSLHLVETSPRLRALQAERVPDATWYDRIDDLPPGPLFLIANEFLDALPIRQFVRRGAGWTERHVADGAFVEQPAAPPGREAPLACDADDGEVDDGEVDDGEVNDGEVIETCEAAGAIGATLGARLAATGGAALFLDYGPSASAPGDSLQAIAAGRPADPLAPPGSADLTAHVDFAAFARAACAAGAAAHGPIAQGLLLARLGLFQRSGQLARTQPPARAAALIEAAKRLAEPDRMGRLFKALALCHPDAAIPPGFEA